MQIGDTVVFSLDTNYWGIVTTENLILTKGIYSSGFFTYDVTRLDKDQWIVQ